MNLVNSSGWLEYYSNGENADFFAPAIEDTRNLVVSTINIYEVLKRLMQFHDIKIALGYIAPMRKAAIISIDEDLALQAVTLSQRYKLPLADSLLYATAKIHNATFWTQDKHFETIHDVKFCRKDY